MIDASAASSPKRGSYMQAGALYCLLLPVLCAFFVSFGLLTSLPMIPAAFPLACLTALFLVHRFNDRNWNFTLRPFLAVLTLLLLLIWVFSFFRDTSIDSLSYHLQRLYLLADGWNPVWQAVPPQWSQPGAEVIWPGNPSGLDHLRILCFAQAMAYANLALYVWIPVAECSLVWHVFLLLASMYPIWCYLRAGTFFTGAPLCLAVFALALNPIVLLQLTLHWIDGALGSLYTLVLFSLLWFVRTGSRDSLPFAVFSLALLGTIKSTGLFYAVVLGSVFLLLLVLYRRNLLRLFLLRCLLPAVLLALVLGFSPYVTNLLHYGNPVYPYAATLSGEDERETEDWRRATTANFQLTPQSNRFWKFFLSQVYASPAGIDSDGLPVDRLRPSVFLLNTLGMLYGPLLLLAIFLCGCTCLLRLNATKQQAPRFRSFEPGTLLLVFLGVLLTCFFHSDTNIPRFFPQFWLLPVFFCLLAGTLCTLRHQPFARLGSIAVFLLMIGNSLLMVAYDLPDRLRKSDQINRSLITLAAKAEFFEITGASARQPLIHADFLVYPVWRMIADQTGLLMKISPRPNLPILIAPFIPAALRYEPKNHCPPAPADVQLRVEQMWTESDEREFRLFFRGKNLTADSRVFLGERSLNSFLCDDGVTIVASLQRAGFVPGTGTLSGVLRNRFFAMPFTLRVEPDGPFSSRLNFFSAPSAGGP